MYIRYVLVKFCFTLIIVIIVFILFVLLYLPFLVNKDFHQDVRCLPEVESRILLAQSNRVLKQN